MEHIDVPSLAGKTVKKNNHKKVLHIITGLNDGGAESVLTRLCLNSHSVNHVVVSMIDLGKYGSILQAHGIKVHALFMGRKLSNIFKLFKLVHLIKLEQPDVVQTWMYHADLFGGMAAKLAGVRRVCWGVRHSVLERDKTKTSTIVTAKLCSVLSKWIPEFIICCANKALEVHANIGYQRSKMLVIPNGYDLAKFSQDNAIRVRMREHFEQPEECFFIGLVGRYHPFKDHHNLFHALALVKNEIPTIRCLLVGKDMLENNTEIMKVINKLSLQDNVVLAGQYSDISAVMNALDLHVLSSSSEAFPNVLAEAMACGTPCVTTNVGDAQDIVGDNSVCCSSGDSRALANLILMMHNEWLYYPDSWVIRKNACIERIEERFSIQRMVNSYEDIWLKH